MFNVGNIVDTATRVVGNSRLMMRKYSPEILVGVGVACTVGAVVTAARSTLKVDDILEEHNENVAKIQGVHDGTIDIPEDKSYTDEDYKKDLFVQKVHTAGALVKTYFPAATLEVVGVACILCGFGILKKRSVALLGLYKASEEAFASYRKRVVDEYGEEKDLDIYQGVTDRKREDLLDKDGNKIGTVTTANVVPGTMVSPYARFFDEYNPNWSKDASQNMFFLTMVQNQMNDILKSRGHLFLNEVYDALGFERSSAGQLVGWVYNQNVGDDYIDFDIFRFDQSEKRDFVNGEERSILLDFNVAGVVYDLI